METKERSGLQFRIDLALTVLFIAMIFFFMLGTAFIARGLVAHAFDMRYVSQYLEDSDDYTPLEWVEASIASLEHHIETSLYGTDALGKINSTFQYALGKKLVNTGSTQMIRLNTGHLYDLQTDVSMEQGRDDVLAMRDIVPGDIPFLFVYEHPTLYEPEIQMPAGYEFLDYGIQEADELVGMLRDEGVQVMDSRDVLRSSGIPLEDYLLRTDQHWSTRAAIEMARAIGSYVEEVAGVDLPLERLDIDQFDTTVYPKLFMGKYGQRVGTLVVEPDDITVYVPKYETNIRINTNARGGITDKEGAFEDVMIRKGVLRPDAGRTWNTKAYLDYGLTEDYDVMHNEDGAPCSILLLKDSYSAPIGRFLSLVARDVYAYDLRSYYSGSLRDLIEEYDPDIVVTAYSLSMLRQEQYEFE